MSPFRRRGRHSFTKEEPVPAVPGAARVKYLPCGPLSGRLPLSRHARQAVGGDPGGGAAGARAAAVPRRREIEPGDSFPQVLSDGLAGSRFLVLILSPHSSRPWVDLEWTSYIAHHGPLGRLIPVLLEPTEIPALLASVQRIDATHRDAARVAGEIARSPAGPASSRKATPAGSSSARTWSSICREGEELRVTDPVGQHPQGHASLAGGQQVRRRAALLRPPDPRAGGRPMRSGPICSAARRRWGACSSTCYSTRQGASGCARP